MSKRVVAIFLWLALLGSSLFTEEAFAFQDDKASNRFLAQGEARTTQLDADSTISAISKTDTDTVLNSTAAIDTSHLFAHIDSLVQTKSSQRTKTRFIPDPKRALWLALVIPGAGQIYNRKYWKLPIIYGGFIGCTYALMWNQQMYKDYSQAYLDIMDDDPNTKSYENILPPRYNIEGNEDQFKRIFKNKRDYYRRYRDLSAFCFIGVYLLSVIDAYVDAQLSAFDISRDLSLQIEPATINNNTYRRSQSIGLQCNLKF